MSSPVPDATSILPMAIDYALLPRLNRLPLALQLRTRPGKTPDPSYENYSRLPASHPVKQESPIDAGFRHALPF